MKNNSTIKPMLPKWWLSVLLCFFIFASHAPAFNIQQRIPVKTELRETVRSVRVSTVSFQTLHHYVDQPCISEDGFFFSVQHYSGSVEVRIRDQSKQILTFKPNTLCWASRISPRLSFDIPLAS